MTPKLSFCQCTCTLKPLLLLYKLVRSTGLWSLTPPQHPKMQQRRTSPARSRQTRTTQRRYLLLHAVPFLSPASMSSSFRGYGAPDMADVATADVRRGPDAMRKGSRRRKSTERTSASTGGLADAADSAKSAGSLPALPVRSPLKGQTSPSTTGKRGGGFGGLQGKRMDTEAQVEFLNGKLKQAQGTVATKNQTIVSASLQKLSGWQLLRPKCCFPHMILARRKLSRSKWRATNRI